MVKTDWKHTGKIQSVSHETCQENMQVIIYCTIEINKGMKRKKRKKWITFAEDFLHLHYYDFMFNILYKYI